MSLPIVLAHGIARFDILSVRLQEKLNLPETNVEDQFEYFKGIKTLLEANGFIVSHPNQAFYPHKKRPYGTISKDPNKKGTEVPRIALMEEMEKLTDNRLVRSDWIAVPKPHDVLASSEAKGQLAHLPQDFEQGELYVDYVFPD